MTKKQRTEHIKKIKNHLLSLANNKEDRFGHIKNELLSLRYKFQKTSIRIERKTSAGWIKITGAYYKDITFCDSSKQPGKKLLKLAN